MLEFYDFNFFNVVVVVKLELIALDRKMNILIKNKQFFICAFNLKFIKNMSQQLNNRNLFRQNAIYDCNYCSISFNICDKIHYNIIKNE